MDTRLGVPSTVAIGGHPLHPMLIVFPIAFLAGAMLTDLVHAFSEQPDPFWARSSLWLLGAGLVMGAIAAVTGLIEFLTIRPARALAIGWVHFLGNAIVLVIALVNILIRPAAESGIPAAGVVLSILTFLLLCVTGWLGGELSYRHRIGVIAPPLDPPPAAAPYPDQR